MSKVEECPVEAIDVKNINYKSEFVNTKEVAIFSVDPKDQVFILENYNEEEFRCINDALIEDINNKTDKIDLLKGYRPYDQGKRLFSGVQLNEMQQLLMALVQQESKDELKLIDKSDFITYRGLLTTIMQTIYMESQFVRYRDSHFGAWRIRASRLKGYSSIFLCEEYEPTFDSNKANHYAAESVENVLTLKSIRDKYQARRVNPKKNKSYTAHTSTLKNLKDDKSMTNINIFFTSEIDAVNSFDGVKECVEIKSMFKSVFEKPRKKKLNSKMLPFWLQSMMIGIKQIYLGFKSGNVEEGNNEEGTTDAGQVSIGLKGEEISTREKVMEWFKTISDQVPEDLLDKNIPIQNGQRTPFRNSPAKEIALLNEDFFQRRLANSKAPSETGSSRPPSKASSVRSSILPGRKEDIKLEKVIVLDVHKLPQAIFENEEDEYIGLGFLHEILVKLKEIMEKHPSKKYVIEYDPKSASRTPDKCPKIYIYEDDIFTPNFRNEYLKEKKKLEDRERVQQELQAELEPKKNLSTVDKEEIQIATDHDSKMSANLEKIIKKETKKAEKSKMPTKAKSKT